MDMYFTFDRSTRTLSSNRKAYAGQVFDSNSTRLYFTLLDEGEDWDFTKEDFVPNIVFDVLDDRGFPFVYGLNSSPVFNGISFEVPYDITSRARSARVNFQLWFVSAKYQDTFDGTPNGMLRTEYLLSATAGIAIKPSCVKPPACGCGDAPYSPATSPGLIGPIEFYRENALLMPIEVTQKLDGAGLDMTVHTLSGRVQTAYLPVATITEDGKIKIEDLPTGNTPDTIPKLVTSVKTGQGIVYGSIDSVLGTVYGFKGADVVQLSGTVADKEAPVYDSASKGYVGAPVANALAFDQSTGKIQLLDLNKGLLSEVDLPTETLVKSVEYDPVAKKIWFHFENPDCDFAISVDDLVDIYEPIEGELIVSTYGEDAIALTDASDNGVSNGKTIHTIGLAPEFKEKLNGNITRLDGRIDEVSNDIAAHIADINNPHKVTKAQLGLGNVDNTSDMSKPVSEAQRAAIDLVQKNLDDAIALNETAHESLSGKITTLTDQLVALDDRESKITQEVDKQLRDRYVKKEVDDLLADKLDNYAAGDHIIYKDGKINVDTTDIICKTDDALSEVSENPVQNKVVTRALNLKADKGEGVGTWIGEGHVYKTGDVVVYNDNLYVSREDNNTSHPTDNNYWNAVKSGTTTTKIGLTLPTYIGVFGNAYDTEYTIQHNLGSRNLTYSFMFDDGSYRFVNAEVSAPTENTIKVRLTNPPGLEMIKVNIVKVDTLRTPEYPCIQKESAASETWFHDNETGLPLYVDIYDSSGYAISGDIIQGSLDFNPLTVRFSEPVSGQMIMASTDSAHVHLMTGVRGEEVSVARDLANYYLVQCFKDGEGQSRLDVLQADGEIRIAASEDSPWSGYVGLYEADLRHTFVASDFQKQYSGDDEVYTLTYEHNTGGIVCAQVYANDGGLAWTDIHCLTPDSVTIVVNEPFDGYLLIIGKKPSQTS